MTELIPSRDDNDDLMMGVILTLIGPLLMAGGLTDPDMVRLAARQAIDKYRIGGQADLLAVSQLVGFGLSALDSLRLAAGDVQEGMKIRLRGNANGLNRSWHRTNAVLVQQRQDPDRDFGAAPDWAAIQSDADEAAGQAELMAALEETSSRVQAAKAQPRAGQDATARQPDAEAPPRPEPPEPADCAPVIEAPAGPAESERACGARTAGARTGGTPGGSVAAPARMAPPVDLLSRWTAATASHAAVHHPVHAAEEQERKRCWASAMTQVAHECSTNLAHLPPMERRLERIRIDALTAAARTLTGDEDRPAVPKATPKTRAG